MSMVLNVVLVVLVFVAAFVPQRGLTQCLDNEGQVRSTESFASLALRRQGAQQLSGGFNS